MKEIIVIEKIKEFRPHPALREGVNCIDTKYCRYEKVPETWEDLRKIASDMCIEKKIDLRFLDDGSFVILLPNKKLIFCSLNSVKKSYYKLLWALED